MHRLIGLIFASPYGFDAFLCKGAIVASNM